MGISFHERNIEWVKTISFKNRNNVVALEDDWVLNNVYLADQLPDIKIGARPLGPRWATAAQAE